LLSDTDGAVINAYRVLRDGGDPAKPIAKRITFYVNPDGRIVAVDTKIKPATAAEDSLAILELLGAKKDEK
jgi:peroxiredoxin